jgi:hypothetical protein
MPTQMWWDEFQARMGLITTFHIGAQRCCTFSSLESLQKTLFLGRLVCTVKKQWMEKSRDIAKEGKKMNLEEA